MLDSIFLSFRNIFKKGIRTTLTILGISVGVVSVMLINTISDIGIKTINNELDSLGLNGISVTGDKCSVDNNDLNIIKKQKGVSSAMPILTSKSKISNSNTSKDIMLWGVDSGASQVVAFDILFGRSFENYDINSKENVCLIDETAAKAIFKRKNCIGKKIKILVSNTYEDFKIIGVTSSGSGILQNIMGSVVPVFCYIPYTTFQQTTGTDELYQIAIKLNSEDLAKSVSKSIKTKLDIEKGVQGSVKTGDLAAGRQTLIGLLDTITIIFSIVSIITLLVAGLGIMTVMLVSVNERTREIGIKKAIGANFFNIMSEFLFEALTISTFGSIIGITVGIIIILLGSMAIGVDFSIKISTLILSFSSALIIGAVFGIYPAYKAAKMKIIDALRE